VTVAAAFAAALTSFPARSSSPVEKREVLETARLEGWDPAFDAIVDQAAKVEKLAQGYGSTEGPVWIRSGRYLLFTDVRGNTIWKWSEQVGLQAFLSPSGAVDPDPAIWREAGANGLFADRRGAILLADTGNCTIIMSYTALMPPATLPGGICSMTPPTWYRMPRLACRMA
jgi:hypothetical protein